MKEEEIKRLLDRYYSGDTSLTEENLLKEYFSGDDVAPGFKAEAAIFRLYAGRDPLPGPSDELEMRIIKSIDDLELSRRTYSLRRIYISLAGIAAISLVMAGSYFFFIRSSGPADTFSDPQIAYAETMKILYGVSEKLNRGTESLKPLENLETGSRVSINSINKTASIITESLEQIKVVNMLSETEDQDNR